MMRWIKVCAMALILFWLASKSYAQKQPSISEVSIVAASEDIKITISKTRELQITGGKVDTVGNQLKIVGKTKTIKGIIPLAPSIHIKTIAGNIMVQSDFDSVESDMPPINLMLKSASGNIRLLTVIPSNLTAYSISGDVLIDSDFFPSLSGWQDKMWKISSVSGDVTIYTVIPTDLQVNTVSGDIVVELDSIPKDMDTITYTLNTASGDIYISPEPVDDHIGPILVERSGKVEGKEFLSGELFEEEEERPSEFEALPFGIAKRTFSPQIKGLGNFIGYNRVDGFWLGGSISYSEKGVGQGRFGVRYAFGRKNWQGWAEFSIPIVHNHPTLSLKASAFSATASYDRWLISDGWNVITASIVKLDYRDYFHRKGFEFGLGIEPIEKVKIAILHEKSIFEPVEIHDNWSLFYLRSRDFRPNPTMDTTEFEANKLRVMAAVEPVAVSFEVMFGNFGETSFKRYFGILGINQPIGNHELSVSLIAGANDPSLPFPFKFALGGYGTLHAFDFKEFEGDKFVLLRPELNMKIENKGMHLTFELGKIADQNGSLIDSRLHADIGFGLNFGDKLRLTTYYPITDERYKFKVFLEKR